MVAVNLWDKQELAKLRSLHIDPVRSNREKLTSLIKHFKKQGGVWSISEGGKVLGIQVSRVLARKVRDLTLNGQLDWILYQSKTHSNLHLDAAQVELYTDGIAISRFASIEVISDCEMEEKNCQARVVTDQLEFDLPFYIEETSTIEIDPAKIGINKKRPVKIIVAFVLPPPNKSPSGVIAKPCDNVPMYVHGRYDPSWGGEGCWLAYLGAMENPQPNLKSFLQPGQYKIAVTLVSAGIQWVIGNYILQSPNSWEELEIKPVQ